MKFKTRGAAKTLSLALDAAAPSATSTWPPKARRDGLTDGPGQGGHGGHGGHGAGRSPDVGSAGRPRTATLDKPLVLDIALLGVLDMTTLTRRGLLDAYRFRSNNKNGVKTGVGNNKAVVGVLGSLGGQSRQTSRSRASSRSDVSGDESTPVAGRRRGANALVRQKKTVIEEDDEESSWAEEDPANRYGTYRIRRNNRLNRTFRVPALKRQPLTNILNNNNNINENGGMELKGGARGRRGTSGPSLEEILSASSREQVPEPCRTCGRPELPERLHSHPKQPGKAAMSPQSHHGYGAPPMAQVRGPAAPAASPPELPAKSSVRKPVPIKYRPRRGSEAVVGAVSASALEAPPAPTRTRSPARSSVSVKAASPTRKVSPTKGSPAKGTLLVTYFVDADGPVSPSRAARAPRLAACFVCGREFSTASLPLHEPQCIQRWQLQNSKLPSQWQRQLSQKPVGPITLEDWNKFATESAKRADSVQCPNCLRRFCPDRINSHERVCFKKQQAVAGEPQTQADSMASAHGRGSPLVECHLCGKKFGTRSIGIHEPQCLKKWQQLHSEAALAALAPDKPRDCLQIEGPPEGKPLAIEFPSKPSAPTPIPTPTPGLGPGKATKDRPRATSDLQKAKSAWAGESGVALEVAGAPIPAPAPNPAPAPVRKAAPTPAGSGRSRPGPGQGQSQGGQGKGPLRSSRPGRPLRCYLCGQMFGLQSLPIHEPQCLQKWRIENAKLPPHLQRPEPEKPDIIFTESGDVDYWRTFDRIWANHTGSLIPCRTCGRRFFPDRIQIHEHACIGNQARR